MSKQYPGGIISKTPVTPSGPYSNDTASGIWTLDQQAYWQKLGQWPTAGNNPVDPQFNYVTMLLHGDGTNGAQNNTFLDSSTNNFTITRNGNTTQGSFSPYGSNWSNYFGTVNDNALLFTELTLSSDFTIETWIYPTAQSSSGYTITFSASSSAEQIMYYYTDGRIGCYFQNGANGVSSAGKLSMNAWSHVAVVRSGSTVKIYVNGVDTGVSISGSSTVTVGTISGYTTGSGYNVYGYLSNVRIGTTAVYTSNFTPPTAPLTAITGTLLLTCQSNRYVDNSTSARAITTLGTPSVQRFNPFGASAAYSTSVIGGSGYFDGSGDSLSLPNDVALDFGTGDFTIEVWIYPTSLPTSYQCVFITCNNVGSAGGIGLFTQSTGEIEVFEFVGNSAVFNTSGFNLKTNQWTNIAITRSGSTNTLYKNGVSFATATNSTNYNSSTDAVIGNSTTASQTFYGYISALRVLKGTAQAPTITTPPTNITNTSLLLNMTNGAIFDNAMMNDLETVGNAQISTSVKKFGTGSLYFDGTGDYLVAPNNPAYLFNTGDFTVELFYYPLGLTGTPGQNQLLVGMWGGGTSQASWLLYLASGNLYWYTSTNGSTQTASMNAASGMSVNNWYHLALVRSSGTTTIYVNGTSIVSTATVVNLFNATCSLIIGYNPIGGTPDYVYGYIDELRITKGYARYTANFTPPTAAFFNYGPT